jgi:murein DD-endopeptidase MepM/ murein hydrolase activator NlpD
MEKNGDLSYWSVIFKANSFVDLLDRLQMIQEIAQSDKERLEEMKVAADAVLAAKTDLETEKESLEASKEELNASQVELDAKRAEADKFLVELVAIGQEYEDLLEIQEEEQYELALEIAQAEEDYKDAKAAEWAAAHPPVAPTPSTTPSVSVPSSSGWILPCSYWSLTSPYGWRVHPIYGYDKFHYGVDLAGATGTPIYASRAGTVTTATYGASGGYYVGISHGDGFSSLYLHMTHYIVYAGQYVEQGQVIGYMGSTGASTGPHLHFGISYNGSYVNPANYIPI